ncbi:MAG: hypothetical protein KKE73_10940 [Proteobacteria bacterium]|nr:hypothetical protein [Pseudomonadota bacterium]
MSKLYRMGALTGGTDNALDKIAGDNLNDGDGALVFTDSGLYVYLLKADSGLAEDSPAVISPDANAGDKRWIWAAKCDTTDLALFAQFAAAGVWTAQQRPARATDTGATSYAWNVAAAQILELTLTDDCTIANPTNMVAGTDYLLVLDPDGHAVTAWGDLWDWGSAGEPDLSVRTMIHCYYDGTNLLAGTGWEAAA